MIQVNQEIGTFIPEKVKKGTHDVSYQGGHLNEGEGGRNIYEERGVEVMF